MNVTDMSQPSKTAYDDAFLTLLHDCSHLIIPVVNLIFNKNYTGQETIIFAPNEFYLSKAAGGKEKRITDSCFSIVGADGKAIHYHFECESNLDQSIMLRVYSYDSLISSRNAMAKGYSVVAQYPRTAVLALRYQKAMPDAYPVLIENGDGSLKGTVPILKVRECTLEDIFRKNLLFLLPFFIFTHEKSFKAYERDATKLQILVDEYHYIAEKLDALQDRGTLTALAKKSICAMIVHVLALIAKKYPTVRKEVGAIMFGKIVDYEAKRIYNEGYTLGKDDGYNLGKDDGYNLGREAEKEENAKAMLRDKVDPSIIEKYTKLALPRIKELAQRL